MNKPDDNNPDRRDFLRSALAAILTPGALLDTLTGDYPWIKDAGALAAMKELDQLNNKGSADFRMPGVVENYVLGIEAPKPQTVKSRTLFGDLFWKSLSTRNKSSIHTAVLRARDALKAEEALEPRRRELVAQIKAATGEEAWLLRLNPDMRHFFKRIIAKDFPKDLPEELVYRLSSLQFVSPEDGLPYMQNGVKLLEEYEQAWINGTLREFAGRQRARLWHEGREKSANAISHETLGGKNYVPSKEEKEAPVNALQHFLSIPSTTIDSGPRLNQTMYAPPVYTAHIRTRRPVNEHIRSLINEILPKDARKSMEIKEASDIGTSTRYLTLINPPASLAAIIEEARQKKETANSLSR